MADPPLTPQQAAQALANIGSYEEGLSMRVGALTSMVWGVVSAATFVTYGIAPAIHPTWVVPFLWLPWTAAGIAITCSAWKLHAISIRRPHDRRRNSLWTLGFTALFAAAVLVLDVLHLAKSAFTLYLVVNGLVAFFIVANVSRRRHRLAPIPVLVAGVFILAGAAVLATLHLSQLAQGFAAAAIAGTGFVGAGLVAFVRG